VRIFLVFSMDTVDLRFPNSAVASVCHTVGQVIIYTKTVYEELILVDNVLFQNGAYMT